MADTDADQRYSRLLTIIEEALGADAFLLFELDEAVGVRLSEAQFKTVRHIFSMWRRAAEGQIEVSLLPDEEGEFIWCPVEA